MSPELESVRRATELAVGAATLEALSRAPEGKWSSLQVLEHLVLSYTATTKGLQRQMVSGEPERSLPTMGHRMRRFYVLGLGRFPAGVEAPKQTKPTGNLGSDPMRQFKDALVAMDASLFDSERRFGRRARVLNHPVLGPLTAEQWRRFHQVHSHHHLRQIATLLAGRE